MERFPGGAGGKPSLHPLTDVERAEVLKVLAQLPAFSQTALKEHVRSISFIDGLAANGITSLEEGTAVPVFNIVLRSSILRESVSEFLTRKERNCYRMSDSGVEVSIEAGSLSALLYVLTHETVHVVDISNRGGQGGAPRLLPREASSQASPPLVRGVWDDARTALPAYRSVYFESDWFHTGKAVSTDTAEATYRALAQTPFVSLYANSNWYEDAAELVTCYYLTQKLGQPYRIVVFKADRLLYSVEPMKSALVRARFGEVQALAP